MRLIYLVGILMFVFLLSCQQEDTSSVGAPFLGGSQGLTIEFAEGSPPPVVYDGGNFPFDIAVKIQNIGEHFASADKVAVAIEGIQPEEFNMAAGGLVHNPPTDLFERRKDPQGNVIDSAPVYVEFSGLNHVQPIAAGSELTYPIKASVCYQYGTIAVSQLCTRKNILDPRGPSICEINEAKTVHNSAGPVQITNVMEQARSIDKVGFTFTISHSGGAGDVFEPNSVCNRVQRELENRVQVRVISNMGGLTCAGLENGDNGYVRLFNGQTTISCTQPVSTPGDYEFPVRIEASYDYEQSTSTQLTVRHTEG